jgi:large subunit ribosomal protein L35
MAFFTFAHLLTREGKICIDMPKMKTHSSAKKRFKVTGSGKIKRFQAYTSHMMRNKSKKAKTRLVSSALVSDADHSRIKRLLCL